MAWGGDTDPRTRAVAGVIAAGRRAGVASGDFARRSETLRKLVADWALAEVAPGRLLPWLAVAFGFGAVLYLAADTEPALWAATPAALVAVALAFLARQRPLAFPLLLGFAGITAGFAVATMQTARIAHPVLRYPVGSATLGGYVEIREGRERSDRVTLRVTHLEGRRIGVRPERVRLAIRKDTAPPVGSFIELKAHLSPPLPPLRPGGYDFARDMYFQQIGASGYALGKIRVVTPPASGGWWLRYAAFLDATRASIDRRIHAVLPGDRGAIASALITGTRDAISTPVNDAMYISSLAHVLSISGYHMAVVAGIVFFVIRGSLALVPGLAIRHPIKKWAAAGAFAAAFFYLLLSGSEVATQRSFIMIGIVLLGVMMDRPALTFRTITLAAFGVLVLAPQAVAHPSFQMSFAATLALVAGYQHGLPWKAGKDTPLAARVALWGGREVAGLILASVVAGFATTPYAAYHFHRLAPYGVLANLGAMPVVSAVVMPAGILGVVLVPFGVDAPCWHIMGWGIDWMIDVVLWVARLPGAVGRVQAFGNGPLLLSTLGILLLCLLRTPLRWSGAVLGVIACIWAALAPRPDVLISADGQTAAFRGADGRLSVLHSGRDAFAVKEWLAADADARTAKDKSLATGARCDSIGCIGALKDGRLVSMVLALEAFDEDCARAAVVVSARAAPVPCKALLVDRPAWQARGAISLRWTGARFEETAARPPGSDRPWAPAPRTRQTKAAPQDATPRLQDVAPADQ
ncbi:MAG TPA: ComEC/Rec2 family competence protein [Pseudolabrys sp.]|uniref:ComEC/Rec2 family competence protein n=1 Tax=Pseudolabrys sp. TaxID=1960880 RepID=UPI002DDCB272|nr:ComEC/Rec2 family competence protein [Pseudolabrys sp.]HEV2630449.1 ComEC/Rec2 family competence protein [Pseudolabrys sp.]